MPLIKVKISYASVEYHRSTRQETTRFILEKLFTFKYGFPCVPVKEIILTDDAIESIPFNITGYEPARDTYHIHFKLKYDYIGGDAIDGMLPEVERFGKFGWSTKRVCK